MPIQIPDLVEFFKKVADLLEVECENRFRIRTCRDAARTCVGGHSRLATSARG